MAPRLPMYSVPMRTRATQSIAAAVALAGVLALSGCGASGPDAPTRMIQKVTDGAEAMSGAINIRDLLLVAQPDSSAALVGTFINEASTGDALTGITVGGIPAELAPTPLPLKQNTPIIFSGDSSNATGTVPGLNIAAGRRVDVVVTFAHAPSVTVSAMVRAKTDYFAQVGDAPIASTEQVAPDTKK
jgi:hypothetical protein